MTIDDVRGLLEGLGGVRTQVPGPGDGTPEVAWGDHFFTYDPAAGPADHPPSREQPFATIVTKDYPGDDQSGLDARTGAFRVNVIGAPPARASATQDPREPDAFFPHPVYRGWTCVVDPGPRTDADLRDLLRAAHAAARLRYEKRTGRAGRD